MYRAVAIHYLKPDTAIRTKGSFLPNLWLLRWSKCNLWGHVRIEIPYPAQFPLWIPHPKPIKTLNSTPARNCNSGFPPLFSAQIPNITAKKSQIPHPAKPIGDPLIRHENERSSNRRNLKTPGFRTDWKHFEKGLFRKWWRHDNHVIFLPVFLKHKSKLTGKIPPAEC